MSGPWRRLVRTQWAPIVALAVLTLITALLTADVPARVAAGYDRAAATAIGDDADVVVENTLGSSGGGSGIAADPNRISALSARFEGLLPPDLRAVTGPAEAAVSTAAMLDVVPRPALRRRLFNVSWDVEAGGRVRYVAGDAPATGASPGDVLQVALGKKAAAAFGYRPGTELTLAGSGEPLRVRVSGIYEPLNAADPFWRTRQDLVTSRQMEVGRERTVVDVGAMLIDATGYRALTRGPDLQLTYSWRFPVRASLVTSERAGHLPTDVEALRSRAAAGSPVLGWKVVTQISQRLADQPEQLGVARVILSLVLAGLAAAAAGVMLLAAGLLTDRVRPILALMRARGAAIHQLAATACGLAALAVVPAAVAGYGLGRLLNGGPQQRSSIVFTGALGLVVLALPVALVVLDHGVRERSGQADRRADLATARPSKRRLVLEGLAVVLAVTGVALSRQRALSGQARLGTDPLIAAVPVLLAIALGLLVLRAYPYPLRLLGRLLRRSRSAVGFLGVAHAGRRGGSAALPLVVLLLVAAVAGFAVTVDAALRDAQRRATAYEVGADARIQNDGMDPGVLTKLRALRGVTAVTPARTVLSAELTSATGSTGVNVVAVDLNAYRRMAGGAARLVPAAPGDPMGALLSPAAAREVGNGRMEVRWPSGVQPIAVRGAGVASRFPGPDLGPSYVIIPYGLLAGSDRFPTTIFIRGRGLDQKTLEATARSATPLWASSSLQGRYVWTRTAVLNELTGVPLTKVVRDQFARAGIVVAAYGALTLLLMLLVEARARRLVAHLQVLGLSRRQSRGLAVLEIAPAIGCAVVAGWALGLALPGILGPLVDLRPYTHGVAAARHLAGPVTLLAPAGALVLAAALAAVVDAVSAARRRGPAGALRTGNSP
ncbi:hypothetical protein J4573_09085 [Actinomadura barringtoniae]|uniref:ABC3 transporter permease C-terminal domain-containing protein n=1 Tax=Actinomadura barringtoniae TaxID=1427535 RepID=A0A939P7M6_9ACTN|nr:FtsX-like permease family protein [Actinomadura barringtoniae]MBO2447236.1 hypothetical protein [Actinomadura barringtoniae]